ncbi:hypothetical protein, partial [Thiolapillus sp.]|uniref:hypothetical protein n=1 Tax=Thiolapillus sp. TaxID=2017437 RepID=UPI003AF758F0
MSLHRLNQRLPPCQHLATALCTHKEALLYIVLRIVIFCVPDIIDETTDRPLLLEDMHDQTLPPVSASP